MAYRRDVIYSLVPILFKVLTAFVEVYEKPENTEKLCEKSSHVFFRYLTVHEATNS